MTIQTPAYEQVRDAWDAIASGFDEFITPKSIEEGEEVLRRLDIRSGTRFLDVAAGSGALSIPAARRGAEVVATDIAPTMIERLTARARAERLNNVEGRVMDCHALDFPDATFDVAASMNGVTMSPDLAAGLTEMARVTKPGGTVLVVAFGPLQKTGFLASFASAIKTVVPDFPGGLPGDPPPPPFQLADPDVFASRFGAAGLGDVVVDAVTWDMAFDSAMRLWHFVAHSNPIGAQMVAMLTESQGHDVRQVLDRTLREQSGDAPGLVVHVEVNIGTGRKGDVPGPAS